MNETVRYHQFDHFIPVSTELLMQKLMQSGLSSQDQLILKQLREILSFEYYQKLVELKKSYQPFNPDNELTLVDRQNDQAECVKRIDAILTAANYTLLTREQIEYALEKSSPYGLEIHIDFELYDELKLYYRGKSQKTEWVRDWKSLYLKKKPVNLINYQRLFLMLSYRDPDTKPGIHLKLFRDILRPDLEMLFPDSRVRMKLFDKIKLGITGGGGTAGGIFATIGKISAAVSPWTIVIAVAGFAALVWRQISKVFIQRTRYMATLAQNLYFHNLDNNAGAITYLIDLARQEEIKEAILAYAMLRLQPASSIEALDSACEQWFQQQFDMTIDFDVSDAVNKLERLGALNRKNQSLSLAKEVQISDDLNTLWRAFINP